MDVTLRRFRRFLIVWFVFVALLAAWINIFRPAWDDVSGWSGLLNPLHPAFFGIYSSTLTIVPLLLFVQPIARAFGGWGSAIGRACWAFGLSTVAFGLGNLIWLIYNLFDQEPYPSLADAGYLSLLPLMTIGLVSMTRVLGVRGRDSLIIVGGFIVLLIPTALLTWTFDIGGATFGLGWLIDPESPGALATLGNLLTGDVASFAELANLISVIYILMDVVLISMAFVVMVYARRAAGGIFLLPIVTVACACAAQYLGDMVFFKGYFTGNFYDGDLSDVGYFIGMFLLQLSVYLFGRAYLIMTGGMASSLETATPTGEVES
jgi:hypothetical protein